MAASSQQIPVRHWSSPGFVRLSHKPTPTVIGSSLKPLVTSALSKYSLAFSFTENGEDGGWWGGRRVWGCREVQEGLIYVIHTLGWALLYTFKLVHLQNNANFQSTHAYTHMRVRIFARHHPHHHHRHHCHQRLRRDWPVINPHQGEGSCLPIYLETRNEVSGHQTLALPPPSGFLRRWIINVKMNYHE